MGGNLQNVAALRKQKAKKTIMLQGYLKQGEEEWAEIKPVFFKLEECKSSRNPVVSSSEVISR